MSLDNLEQRLKARVTGQDEAVKQVSQALRRARTGARNPTRPVASFLFDGASGVGKTKLAKAIAIEFLGTQQSFIHVDFGGYMDKDFLPLLSESLCPYASRDRVILFSEIEYATPAISKSLLQIIDDGEYTGQHEAMNENPSFYFSRPHLGDFSYAIIIMTSNIGKEFRYPGVADSELRQRISGRLTETFREQLLYRIDAVVLFRMLGEEDMMRIVEGMVGELVEKMRRKSIGVRVMDELKTMVVSRCYSGGGYSAKQLKWAFARLVEDQLADALLEGKVKGGGSIDLVFDRSYQSLFTCPARVG